MKAHRDPRLAAHLQTRETFNYSRGTKREQKTALRLACRASGLRSPLENPRPRLFAQYASLPRRGETEYSPQTLVRVVSVSGRCGPYKRSGELNAALRKIHSGFPSQTGSPRENRIYLQITNNVRDLAWKKRSDHPADARHSLSRNSVRPYLNLGARERSVSDNRWQQAITQRQKSSPASSSM